MVVGLILESYFEPESLSKKQSSCSAGYSTASSRIAGTIIKSGKVASDLTSPGFPDWLALPGNRYLYKVTAVNPNG